MTPSPLAETVTPLHPYADVKAKASILETAATIHCITNITDTTNITETNTSTLLIDSVFTAMTKYCSTETNSE